MIGFARRIGAAVSAALLTLPLACADVPFRQGQQANRSSASDAPEGCGPASVTKKVRLNRPRSVVLDRFCNLYIADTNADRVVKVDAAGAVTTVAGGGTATPTPGTAAIRARLGAPQALSTDSTGNLYVGTDDGRVLRVALDGTLQPAAGIGSCGTGGPPSGLASQAPVCVPSGLATDALGSLFIADSGNRYVMRVTPPGAISVLAGIGERESSGDDGPPTLARIGDPQGLAVDAAGALYISDGYSTTVRKISGGRISRLAGGGASSSRLRQPALQADIYPEGLALDGNGNLYIADDLHHQVRRMTPDGMIETVAGNGVPGWSGDRGPATAATLRFPRGVALDASGNVYIADTGNDHIRRLSRKGVIATVL